MSQTALNNLTNSLPTSLWPYLVTSIVLFVLPVAYLDYRAWYNLGPGGVPHNVIGWILQGTLKLVLGERDLRATECFDRIMKEEQQEEDETEDETEDEDSIHPKGQDVADRLERKGCIDGELPVRKGKETVIGRWATPQRMIEERASKTMHEALRQLMDRLVSTNPTNFSLAPSKIECGSPALFLAASQPSPRHIMHPAWPREWFHLHDAEGSMHAVLSAADAKQVAKKGWGCRHALSGKRGAPWGYMMLFVPRDQEELQVVEMIVRGAAKYALDGAEVK